MSIRVFKSYQDLSGKILSFGDILEFNVKGAIYVYEVHRNYLNYINKTTTDDAIIFSRLGIIDKRAFCSQAYGYESYQGCFPECEIKHYEALTRVALALFKECEKFQSLYKAGDTVTILEDYLPGTSGAQYLCNFTKTMLENFAGHKALIEEVYYKERASTYSLNNDPFYYKLQGVSSLQWSAEMFQETYLQDSCKKPTNCKPVQKETLQKITEEFQVSVSLPMKPLPCRVEGESEVKLKIFNF